MQGDRIGEESGKVTSQRVLSNPGGGPRMETSLQASGTILGVPHTSRGTYVAAIRPDGHLFGEGQGIVVSKEGDMASWVGQGVGTLGKDGSVSYRGALYYQSSSAKWARLNSVALMFEYDVDPAGNTRAQFWEWK